MQKLVASLVLVIIMLLSPFASTQANYQLDDDSVAMEATDGFYNASVWDNMFFLDLAPFL